MSRSSRSQPTPEADKHYIGDKPVIDYSYEPYDKHYYARRKQAKQLGVDESELNDEPDYIESDIGYDKHIKEN